MMRLRTGTDRHHTTTADIDLIATRAALAVIAWIWASPLSADDAAGRSLPTDQGSSPYAYTNDQVPSHQADLWPFILKVR